MLFEPTQSILFKWVEVSGSTPDELSLLKILKHQRKKPENFVSFVVKKGQKLVAFEKSFESSRKITESLKLLKFRINFKSFFNFHPNTHQVPTQKFAPK